jgi:hypothetical protein
LSLGIAAKKGGSFSHARKCLSKVQLRWGRSWLNPDGHYEWPAIGLLV